MNTLNPKKMGIPLRVTACALLVALAGCAGLPFGDARPDSALSPEERLATLQQKKQERPDDIDVSTAMEIERQQYVHAELRNAEYAVNLGNDSAAAEHLKRVIAMDPGNYKARQEQLRLERRAQVAGEIERARALGATRPLEALDILGKVLAEQPNHAQARRLRNELLRSSEQSRPMFPKMAESLERQVSLNFKQQPISAILDAISRVAGVNFVFDREVDTSAPATLFAEKMTAQNAISLLLRANHLERKILDGRTVLLYPSTEIKKKEYQDFAIRTFFLSHADAKSVVSALRQLVKPKDVYVDERVNAVVLRDKPETIMVAERIVMSLDIPQSEVTLDVQVLEVNMNDTLDLGVRYPERLQLGAAVQEGHGKMTLGELLALNRDRINVSSESGALSLAIDMLQKQGKTKTLANPKIRVRNMEKASIKIGERVPIVTTTNANGVVSESVSYQDVGLSLQVEPRISLNDEVSVKVNMEVSSILSKHTTKTGLVAYSLGTRNAQTLMTARNSETQVLAGLIKRAEADSISGLPGLSQVPGVGRLFGSNGHSEERSEIVLLITPHIERSLDLPVAAVSTFLAGTESNTGMESNRAPQGAGLDMDAPIRPPEAVDTAITQPASDAAEDNVPGAPAQAGAEGRGSGMGMGMRRAESRFENSRYMLAAPRLTYAEGAV
ncbi:secretin N-terminal domain-containing protein [Achromobacter xylosoxidans]|uniref:secretin N-terminal domain-containing protein n=1 Tax=Alcaligenes xylosoxydans xylosoxydans TaxID=85698 RepID=UPI00192C3877|nr:secretin N-terminal domain-containing protein [Achromobacter xylosoxidans]MDC6162354.1 secretin N-terminal domain-containing protein [Achromobacter xylosoxidans]